LEENLDGLKCLLCNSSPYLQVSFRKNKFPKSGCGKVTHYFCPSHTGTIQAIQDLSKGGYDWKIFSKEVVTIN